MAMKKKISSISDVYSSVLVNKPPRSKFNMSHRNVMSLHAGEIVPFLCVEAMPGDVWSVSAEMLIKAAPLIAPIMDQVNCKVEFWKVYNRLVFPKWKNYINPVTEDDSKLVLPYINTAPKITTANGSLWDYLGLPTLNQRYNTLPNGVGINALPFLAYQLVWNEFYRDPNLQDELLLPHQIDPFYHGAVQPVYLQNGYTDGDYNTNVLAVRNRCWEKDYFTTAQPDVQRGDDVMLNMSGNAIFNTNFDNFDAQVIADGMSNPNWTNTPLKTRIPNEVGVENSVQGVSSLYARLKGDVSFNGPINMESGISINDLRELSTLQRYKERLQLIGDRYVDYLLGMYGVRSSDASLQRPQYVGGGRVRVSVGEVLQNSESTPESPQGNQSGQFFALSSTPRCHTFFEEAGYLIGVITIMPRTSYYQGVPRQYQKRDRFDFALPIFANLGEQPVYLSELFTPSPDSVSTYKNITFGYQQRYAEYKSIPSSVHGSMRGSLDFWHWSRKFTDAPALGSKFVECSPDKRIFAVIDENIEEFYAFHYLNAVVSRELPRVAVPTLR